MAVQRKPAARTNNTTAAHSSPPIQSAPDAPPEPDVQPTEQIPFEPTPVAARSAVNRGKTGLGSLTSEPGATGPRAGSPDARVANIPSGQPAPRRHLLSSDLTVAILVGVVVSALIAWGVGTAVAASVVSNDARLAPAAIATSTPQPAAGATDAAGRAVFRGTIENMAGTGASSSATTWTVLTRGGETLTVAITSSTRFGTQRLAESASDFALGDAVVVVAARSHGVITAIRVAEVAPANQTVPIPTPTSTATT